MNLPWKYTVIVGVIIIHVFILALFFSPGLLASFKKDNSDAPQQAQPALTENPASQPSTPPVLDDPPPSAPPKTTTANNTSTPPKTTAANNTSTPPKTTAANNTSTPPAKSAGSLSKLKPYHAGHYHSGTRPLSKPLTTAVGEIRSGILIDLDTHTILWEKDSSKPYPIASLTKMMTSLMLLRKVETTPGLSLDGTTIQVTKEDRAYLKSAKINGVYLDAGEVFCLRDYLKCMIISSANDAAYIIGKYLGDGDLERGVQRMNEQAKQLGLNDMSFHNPNGLPIDHGKERTENNGSAISVAYLAECVMAFPEYMKWAGTTRDAIMHGSKPFDLNSTNHLLRNRVPGVTGLKTGFTDTAGYCIAVSCTREGRTMLLVVMGVRSRDRREAIAKQLLDWAFQQPAK